MRLIKLKVIIPPNELVTKAKLLAEKNEMLFTGDTERGQINGSGIEAHYRLREDELIINILRKPPLLSWSAVEQKVIALVNIHQQVEKS